jgi:hypothetical protein
MKVNAEYYNQLKNKKFENLTLAEHAEMWWVEKGNILPKKDTIEWQKMYKKWVDYAFKDFNKH